MAFKMKAGKEGPMYKNFGIGKDSPYNKISNDDKKHGFKESKKREIEDKERREKTSKELYPVTGSVMTKKSPMTFEKGDTTYDGYRVHSTGYNPLDTEARKRKVNREHPDATEHEIWKQLGRRKYQNYTHEDEKQYVKDQAKKEVMDKKKAEWMEKNKAELEANPEKAKYMEQKHKEYMASRSNK